MHYSSHMARNPASGRERDTALLVDAAIALFGERGPDAVSLREVAAAAGVNYGLIHQYVGTKDDLLRLALRRVSSDSADRFSSDPVPDTVDRLVGRQGASPSLRLLAWAILMGRSADELMGRSVGLPALAARVGTGDDEARAAVVVAMSLLFGWQLFGDYLTAVIDLPPAAREGAARTVRDEVRRLLGVT